MLKIMPAQSAKAYSQASLNILRAKRNRTFYSRVVVACPLNESEAGGDLVFFKTGALFFALLARRSVRFSETFPAI